MEFHQLKYFCAVARTGTFTRAAQAAHVAQPSLSQQILKLEDELGAKLFDRLPREARLTPFGKAFLPRAQTILSQVADARMEIQEMAGVERGTLIIGAIPTIAPYLLPPVLMAIKAQHPHIVVSMVEDSAPQLLHKLREGEVDVTLMVLPISGTDFKWEELFRERLFVALPSGHHLAGKRNVSLQELKNEPFLLLKENHCFRDDTLLVCSKSGVHPHVIFESSELSTILTMIAAGIGVAIVPDMAIDRKRPGCEFVPLDAPNSGRRIGFVRSGKRCPSRAVLAFEQQLKMSYAMKNCA